MTRLHSYVPRETYQKIDRLSEQYRPDRLCGHKNPKDIYIIFGAGRGGKTLGEVEWDERIVMTTYDWTKISKSLGIEWGKIKLRDHIWFQKAQTEVMLSATVTSLDVE
ncbi:Apoptosis-inducing factor 3 [Folsomia candida]|uniref:Apoptosis-inducing factor 3 n=1 Tax=Folsomia candida TaxID=158441 RepID=A0A226DFX1_FOLCA|nr:Apoptosis-inducing factor 3 [Folsomia candida]